MKITKHYFNLIEILLTVAVISLGIVIVLGMLPKGLRASRSVAAVSYASGVIEEIGTFLQKQGADYITQTSDFDDDVINDIDHEILINDCLYLIEHKDSITSTAITTDNDSDYRWCSPGLFKLEKADNKSVEDVYIVVMGDRQEIDGEYETRLDFSGMIRICKDESPVGYFIAVKHTSDADHDCFNEDGEQLCGRAKEDDVSDDFAVKARSVSNSARVYVELSYPLSLPYEDRNKMYYSFDVKK